MPGQPAPGSNPNITFDCTGLTVSEPGLEDTMIIETTTPWEVTADYSFGGNFAAFMVALPLNVEITVRAESLGPGDEKIVGSTTIQTTAGQLHYGVNHPGPKPTVNVPPNTLQKGVYKLVGTVTPVSQPVPPPMAAFFEGPIIRIV